MTTLAEAVARLHETASVAARNRTLRPLERAVERAAARMWRKQRGQVLDWLADNRDRYLESLREAMTPDEFDRIWQAVADATSGPMADALDEMAEQAVGHGYRATARDVRIGASFDLANPRAVAFLEQFGARRVTGLNRTTHAAMRDLLTRGVDQGWSYARTARQIREQFDGFTRTRAELVAITETADAYEHGQWMVRADLADQGTATEVAWLAETDACEICSPNPGDGYLPADGVFSSGHTRPPAHPRCRCATITRVADRSRVAPTVPAEPALV